jgi:hypothetical protein
MSQLSSYFRSQAEWRHAKARNTPRTTATPDARLPSSGSPIMSRDLPLTTRTSRRWPPCKESYAVGVFVPSEGSRLIGRYGFDRYAPEPADFLATLVTLEVDEAVDRQQEEA